MAKNKDGSVYVSEKQAKAHAAWAAKQALKQETIENNKAARADRSPVKQLALLDKRLGKDVGAAKERARLKKQIEDSCVTGTEVRRLKRCGIL